MPSDPSAFVFCCLCQATRVAFRLLVDCRPFLRGLLPVKKVGCSPNHFTTQSYGGSKACTIAKISDFASLKIVIGKGWFCF